jgi:tetratricopeptide (TPR) repeat protein
MNESATDVPDTGGADELLQAGIRAEQLGALDRAIASFTEASRAADPWLVSEALTRLADAHRSLNDWDVALQAARKAQSVARAARLDAQWTHALIAEANVFLCRGDFPEAKQLCEQALSATNDARLRGLALQNIGSILAQQGQLGAAERSFSESYGQFQRAGYRRGEAIALNNYGRVALDRGNIELAEGLLHQALTLARELEEAELIALATLNLAEALHSRGEHHKAEDLASEALGFFIACGNRWREVECLRLIGAINVGCSSMEHAVRCFERGLQLAEEIGAAGEIHALRQCLENVRRQA